MTGSRIDVVAALREVWATLRLQGRALGERAAGNLRSDYPHHHRPYVLKQRSRWGRRCVMGAGIVTVAAIVSCGLVWWQLGSGAISVGVMTPWLTSAIEEKLGGQHKVEVGGTVLERDEVGRSALRLRDIVVRDAQGAVIASAPKAEVGLIASSLLTGKVQTDRLSLIGAALSLRIEPGGHVSLLSGGTEPLIPATTSSIGTLAASAAAQRDEPPPAKATNPPAVEITSDPLTALLAWIDRLDSLGLDGGSLAEIGLKDCTLTVDDQRTGKRLTFESINLSLTRPQEGGVAFAVNSTGAGGLWSLTATVTPKPDGRRTIEAVLRDASPKDIMLAMRAGDGHLDANVPLSAVVRAEIERDGKLQALDGRILAGRGYFGARGDPESQINIDEAQLLMRWNGIRRRASFCCRSISCPGRAARASSLNSTCPPRRARRGC